MHGKSCRPHSGRALASRRFLYRIPASPVFLLSVYADKHKRLKWLPYRQRAYGHSEDKAQSPGDWDCNTSAAARTASWNFSPRIQGCRFPFPWLQAYFRAHHTAAADCRSPAAAQRSQTGRILRKYPYQAAGRQKEGRKNPHIYGYT